MSFIFKKNNKNTLNPLHYDKQLNKNINGISFFLLYKFINISLF